MVKDMQCSVCERDATCTVDGKPYCNKHYQLMLRYGEPVGRQRKRTNTYTVKGDILEIVTKKGEVILADAEDLHLIEKYSWCISKTGYAVAMIDNRTVKMHRYLLQDELTPEIEVDHINRDGLDNRRHNLRTCSRQENARNIGTKITNKVGHLGIRMTPAGKYNVRIVANRKEIHIGNFDSLDLALKARVAAEDKYHGDFGSHRGKK